MVWPCSRPMFLYGFGVWPVQVMVDEVDASFGQPDDWVARSSFLVDCVPVFEGGKNIFVQRFVVHVLSRCCPSRATPWRLAPCLSSCSATRSPPPLRISLRLQVFNVVVSLSATLCENGERRASPIAYPNCSRQKVLLCPTLAWMAQRPDRTRFCRGGEVRIAGQGVPTSRCAPTRRTRTEPASIYCVLYHHGPMMGAAPLLFLGAACDRSSAGHQFVMFTSAKAGDCKGIRGWHVREWSAARCFVRRRGGAVGTATRAVVRAPAPAARWRGASTSASATRRKGFSAKIGRPLICVLESQGFARQTEKKTVSLLQKLVVGSSSAWI